MKKEVKEEWEEGGDEYYCLVVDSERIAEREERTPTPVASLTRRERLTSLGRPGERGRDTHTHKRPT